MKKRWNLCLVIFMVFGLLSGCGLNSVQKNTQKVDTKVEKTEVGNKKKIKTESTKTKTAEVKETKEVIDSYIGEDTMDLTVPEEIEGLPVAVIEDYAFSGHDELEYVTLPETVTRLCECPFEYCENLLEIDMLGVDTVDTFPSTFRGLESLETIYVGQDYFYDSMSDETIEIVEVLPQKTYHVSTKTWTSAVEVVVE